MKEFSKIVISKTLIQGNLQRFKKNVNKVMAIVKADAYGHGVFETIKALDGKADFFGVANIDEAIEVRKVDKHTPVLILGRTGRFADCVKNDISFIVESIDCLRAVQKQKYKGKAKIHIKINTGMNRLGVRELSEFKTIINEIDDRKVFLEGVLTHLASTLVDRAYTEVQIEKFWSFIDSVNLPDGVLKHIGGSGAMLYDLDKFDMVRVGLGLYGYAKGCKPIMKIVSKAVKIMNVKLGDRVGYNNGFIACRDMNIAIVPLGYFDGFPKILKDRYSVKIGGKKCKLVGNVCMDMCFVDVTDVNICEDMHIVMFDDANDIAEVTGQSLYEVLVNFSKCRAIRYFGL